MARTLTADQQKELFAMLGDPKELDTNTMCKLFARSKKNGGHARYHTDDVITIGPSDCSLVKQNTVTTIGLYIANKFLFEDLKILGYINKPITAKVNGKIQDQMSKAYMNGDITCEQFNNYIDRAQYLYGGPLAMVINVSLSETILTLPQKAKDTREKLLKENAYKLSSGDVNTASHVEHAVVDVALAEMHKTDDPSLAYFDSGCGIDAYNQYKTICVMKGAIQDNTGESPTGYKVVTSNYDTGITKEDMSKIADAVVTTAYSSGVSTQDSGTKGKRYNGQFQDITLMPPNSDCGSKEYLEAYLDEDSAENYVWRWIVENGKLKSLTPENYRSYIGKTVKLRTPIRCKAPGRQYCSKCYGDRAYRLGRRNVGMGFMTISGSTLNASLKKKHDVSIKLYDVTVEDVMKYVH